MCNSCALICIAELHQFISLTLQSNYAHTQTRTHRRTQACAASEFSLEIDATHTNDLSIEKQTQFVRK